MATAMDPAKVGKIAGGIFAVLIVVQHVSNGMEWSYSPSWFLYLGAEKAGLLMEQLGWFAAMISSWPRHLKLDRLLESAWDIVNPIIKFIGSGYMFFSGYSQYVTQMYRNHPYLTIFGSVILLGVNGYLLEVRFGVLNWVRRHSKPLGITFAIMGAAALVYRYL